MMERLLCQLKTSLMCHPNVFRVKVTPHTLLGFCSVFKDDVQAPSANLVYEEAFRLSSKMLISVDDSKHFKDIFDFMPVYHSK